MTNPPANDWPQRMALHMAMTKPVSVPEPMPCPKCEDEEMEPLWQREEGELPPPFVCPSCLHLIEEEPS
jgi:hypothetical protein